MILVRPFALYVLLILAVIVPRALYVNAARSSGGLNSQFSAELVAAGKSIRDHGTIGYIYPSVDGPSAHVAPLYAYLLASVFAVVGYATPAASLMMCVLAIACTAGWVALMPAFSQRLVRNRTPGWLAAFAYALYPGFFYQDSAGDWDHPLATLLAMAVLVLALQPVGAHTSRRGFFIGLLLGLTALANPSLAIAAVLSVLVAAFGIKREHGTRVALPFLLIAGIVSVLVVMPWVIRNFEVFGMLIPIRGNAGLELAVGNHDGADGRTPVVSAADVKAGTVPNHPYVKPAEAQRLRELGEPAYMDEKKHQATAWIKSHPDRFAELTLTRARLFWFPPRDFWDASAALGWPSVVIYDASTMLAVFGLVVVFRHSRLACVSLVLFLLAACGPYLITHVSLRYRYPIGSVVWVLAAIALWHIGCRVRNRCNTSGGVV